MAISIFDMDRQRIPNILILILLILGLNNANPFSITISTIASLSLYILPTLITGRKSMGSGDAYLIFISGALLNPEQMLDFLVIMPIISIYTGVLWCWKSRTTIFPMAPAICTALWISMHLP